MDGVASVNVIGAQDRIIEVTVDPEKIYDYNLDVSSIAGLIAAQNVNLPSGTTEGMNKNMSVRTLGKFSEIKDIENVPINTPAGQVLYLKDVARVNDTYSDNSTYARLNGENSLSITISAESDANTVDHGAGKLHRELHKFCGKQRRYRRPACDYRAVAVPGQC